MCSDVADDCSWKLKAARKFVCSGVVDRVCGWWKMGSAFEELNVR